MNAPMGKPNRLKDMLGALLLVVMALLYVTGVTRAPHGVDVDGRAEVEVLEASSPPQDVQMSPVPEFRT